MGYPNLQEHGRERREEQEFRGRSLGNNHPGRNTSNSRRTFTGALEDSKGLQDSSSNQKQTPKLLRQQEVVSDCFNIPRCTSPVPLKQATPQLNLQIPKPQKRNQYRRQDTPTLVGAVKIMKRHTSPYPTPASSPNCGVLLDNYSPPRRAYTCPAPIMDPTKKYVEKMDMFLKSDLISKVVDPSQSSPLGSDIVDRELVPENGMEVNSVPDCFVNPTHIGFATKPGFDNAWIPGICGNPNPEHDLMNTDFIVTLGSVQDLDEDMKNYLPEGGYSEFFPGPDVPIHEVVTPMVTLQNMDAGSVMGPAEFHKSETTVASPLRRDTAAANRKEGNCFLNTPQSLAHLSNDSGTRTPSPARYHFPSKVKGAAQVSSVVSSENAFTNLCTVKSGLGGIPCDMEQLFFTGELTPPNSAHLSPSPSATIFFSKELETPQQVKGLSRESIAKIETLILNPMMGNPDLEEFWDLCKYAKKEMRDGKIGSLKDVESMFLTTRGRTIATSSESYKQFANASLKGIEAAAAIIPECDLRRPSDPVYDSSYFTDKIHEVEHVQVESGKKSTGNYTHQSSQGAAIKLEDVHGEQVIRNITQKGEIAMTQQPQQKPQKRRYSGTGDRLLPTAKRSMIGSAGPSSAANPFDGRQKRRLAAQQKQQLEIQTQPLNGLNTYNHPQPYHQQDFPTVNSSFTCDQSTGKAVAQVQSHEFQAFHDGFSEMLPPPVTPFSISTNMMGNRGFYPPPTPISAVSATSSSSIVSPAGTHSFAKSNSGSATKSKGIIPGFTSNKEETLTYPCELCDKRFPRPCDLTKHKKTHERPFKCDVEPCKYHLEGFPTSKERERHQNDIHAPNSKEWKCEFSPCQYKSKRESNCKQHMEKAHKYVYKRMKRNPRRRDQGGQATALTQRRRRNVQQNSATPVESSLAIQCPNKDVTFTQTPSPRQPKTSVPPQERDLFARPFNFSPQSHISNAENINHLEPSQVQEVTGGSFLGSIGYHDMGMGQPFFEDSSVAAAGYGGIFEDYNAALRGHPDASPTLTPEDFYSTQSTEQYMEPFLPDFSSEGNSFGVTHQNSQPTVGSFHYNGLGFTETLDCESEGDTPD